MNLKHFFSYCILLILSIGTLIGQSSVQSIHDEVSQNQIKAHLTFLASDALQGRNTGSQGLEAAAAYIESIFIAAGIEEMNGLDGYSQNVPFRSFSPPDSAWISIDGRRLSFPEDFIALNGKKGILSGPMVHIGYGSEEDIAKQDLRFKIVVAIAGDGENSDPRSWIKMSVKKRNLVKKAGGLALIEIYQSTSVPWRMLRSFGNRATTALHDGLEPNDLPNIWVGTQDSISIQQLTDATRTLKMYIGGVERESYNSANVVGLIPGTDPELKDEYIVYSAHYDHVGIGRADAQGDTIYNGARDNAVGVTAVVELAKFFAKNPPKRSSIFALFTAEEKGLLGSKWFTNNLPVPANKIKYNFNIDNGGYNDTTIVSVVGLTRTEAEDVIQAACNAIGVTAIEDAAGEQGLFDRSDNVNFAVLGIPAPTFSLGFREFDEEIFKYYHQPGDEVNSLNMNYIEKYVKAYILSSDKISNGDNTPFWNEGDKYYEAGIKLYKK
ncbi:MAG: aminopeptidase YwaD [Saprospiraceae bacterium]|jgi:aminopeptidase YwaD